MARVTVEDCLPMVENRFALVLLATKRTRQLMAGARPLLATTRNKATVQSLREIATGKVRFDRAVRDAVPEVAVRPPGPPQRPPCPRLPARPPHGGIAPARALIGVECQNHVASN